MNSKFIKIVLFCIFLITSSCTACKKSNKAIDKNATNVSLKYNIDKLSFDNDKIKISGKNLEDIKSIKIKYNDNVLELNLLERTSTYFLFNLISNKINYKLIQGILIESSIASEIIPLNTDLCGTTIKDSFLDCSIAPKDMDVLAFDQLNNRWIPKSITSSSISYKGSYDASLGVYPDSTNLFAGNYYIVTKSGNIENIIFDVGDWLIFNGTSWDRIINSSLVKSVFGRTGNIVALKNDYSLDLLKDIDFSTPPIDKDILVYDSVSKKWKAQANTGSGGGSGNLVNTDDLTEGLNNLYFKESRVLDSLLGIVTINNSPILSTDSIKISIGKIQGQINNKENILLAGTASQYLKGDKTWSAFSSDVLGTSLTGLSIISGDVSSSDTILTAFGKLSNINGNFVSKTGNSTITGIVTANSPGGFFAPKASGIDLLELINVSYLNDFFNSFFTYTSNTLSILREKVGINKANPRSSLDVGGQITASSFTDTSGNIDWSKGNVVSTSFDCTSSLNFSNLIDGGSYTIAVTGTGNSQCSFNPTVTGSDAGTVFFKFNPANSTRTANSHTIYSIVRIGNIAYVSWITGF